MDPVATKEMRTFKTWITSGRERKAEFSISCGTGVRHSVY